MKSISAAIVVLSGAGLVLGGALINRDSGTFVMIVGCLFGVLGLAGWYKQLWLTKGE